MGGRKRERCGRPTDGDRYGQNMRARHIHSLSGGTNSYYSNHSPADYCNAVQLSLVILTNRSERSESSNKFNLPFVFLPITAYCTTILWNLVWNCE